MRILITGGLGFVGGRLAAHLAQSGHQIVLGSRKAITSPSWLSQSEVTKTNWEDISSLKQCCMGVDVVVHAAGMNAQDCAADPVAALAFNGVATARLVDAACGAGVQRFIYFSTAHVYAAPVVGIITEDTCPRNLHPYATSHLAGENAVLGADQRSLIQGIVLRLSNAFGSPMHKDVDCWMLLVNDLCRQAVETRKLVLRGSGLQQRDFISMDKVCRATERLAVAQSDHCQTGIFNIGSGVSQSVLAMAQTIQKRCLEVLGFEPELHCKQDASVDLNVSLMYQASRIDSLGFKHDVTNNIAEIDQLLCYCDAVFQHRQRADS